ncbi:MAG: tRNA uridine-5-carboxymethylaminomethyl(34) synthesis GTPase MnmE [Erysipelotrichaceae bacterium]|jgi:tRNA modification GTPase|nr:tRNA uridine-5-carboxymethylaminomethyl(34) synthesis GTPase MnmE [Bacilli bacterium]NLV29260.1 tRNA uridine-5-carboxymethylaminomethyl(34) synthesis GTPase MnmE [Erysipelotrichaceae bacterium]HPY79725.1 tRNA uridine-5-carboxymethylaminomethyl(34) synthesis GTPase MnmE [Bacilli bacterium]HQA55634.1 tRNA uridine-5-carboxymethylaminomethyl(34) synthesis GTPase MnmE [Bacilli bacterium]
MFETIVALATPPLKSALAIIRLSGDDCFDVVSPMFNKDLREITEKTILYGAIVDGDEKIDQVVLLAYKGPRSFTGEDSVEIICHGSMLIVNQIISLAIKHGARLATHGEFSSRAFFHNKIDLIQAESINDVINATTQESKKLSLLSLDGEVTKMVTPIRSKIADILSLIEVNIDFPEYEDIEIANKEKVLEYVDLINDKINRLISNGQKAKIIKDGIRVAIVGKPNVGKSSLLNALIGEDKAIVTDIAGTTRDIVEGDINLKGVVLHLLDTAGIRDSKDFVESIGIDKAKESIKKAELVIVVLDASKTLDAEDDAILRITEDLNRIIVYNKSDKKIIQEVNGLFISALKKDISPLVDEIYRTLGLDDQAFKTPALNNARQIGLLERAKESLLIAKEDALNDLPIDLVAVSIRDAYEAILEILGEVNQIDISKEIFARFCVGK